MYGMPIIFPNFDGTLKILTSILFGSGIIVGYILSKLL